MNQTLPHNPDAERYILGGIILDNDLILQTLDKIGAEDFYVTAHQPIYQAMEHLYDAGIEINHVTVTDSLKTLGVYTSESKTGIAGLLQALVKGVPSSTDITYYVNILKERSRERKKLRLSADLTTALYNSDSLSVETIENDLSELSMERQVDGLLPLGGSVGTGVLQKAHSLGITGTKLIGMPTGILKLDRLTAGLNRQEMMILAARPAMGKALSTDYPVLTPDGWSKMGALEVGNFAVGSNGLPTKVTEVFPQGLKPMYRITFTDGLTAESCDEHLWFVQSREDRKRNIKGNILPLKEINKNLIVKDTTMRYNYCIPYIDPVQFTGIPIKLNPYVLGCLLGGGSLSTKMIGFTNIDKDIIDKFSSLLPDNDLLSGRGKSWRIKRKTRNNSVSDTHKKIQELNLKGCKPNTKFIPKSYLYNSLEVRQELLRGLLDTDGYISSKGYIEYSSVSQLLAEDVKELVLSLGGRVTLTTKIPTFLYGGVKKSGQLSFRLRIFFPYKKFNPFFCGRKAEKYTLYQPKTCNGRYIKSVEYVGDKEAVCIKVDAEDELFTIKDYIVTHNTALALNMAQYLSKQGMVVAMFSMEMSREALYLRLVASIARIDLHRLKTGTLTKVEWARAIGAHDLIAESNLLIDTTPLLTPRRLETELKKAKRRYGKIDMIIIDYIQLMDSNNKKESRQQEVTEISRQLREIAKRTDATMLALSQLSRAPENRPSTKNRPQMSDLRESGCLTGDTEIYLPDSGRYERIDSLVGLPNFNVSSYDEFTNEYIKDKCINAFFSGVKPVFLLETFNGKKIKLTENHKLLGVSGWRALREFKNGDKIHIPSTLSFDTKETYDLNKLAFIALMIGDGCLIKRRVPSFVNQDLDVLEYSRHAAISIWGDLVRINSYKRDVDSYTTLTFASNTVKTHGKGSVITELFKEHGLYNKRSYEKFIPEIVYTLGNKEISHFLRCLWATDGTICIQDRKPRGKDKSRVQQPRIIISYATNSLNLAEGVSKLLSRLNISSKINKTQKGTYRPNYNVTVLGQSSMYLFCTEVGILGKRKTQKIDVALDYLTYSYESYRYDSVRSIEYIGEEKVYDLTTEKTHNFVANNVLVHNSIEQDADIIGMLYREEVYNPDAVKGSAELIITKSRNTALETIDLFYVKTQTRFENVFIS